MYESSLNERKSSIDWTLLLALFGLMGVGTAFIYSASFANESARTLVWFKQLYAKQVIWYGTGFQLAAGLCSSWIIEPFVAGRSWVIGSRSCFSCWCCSSARAGRAGGETLDQSGFLSISTVGIREDCVHFHAGKFPESARGGIARAKIFLKALGMIALPFILILKEPDLGSALVFFPMGLLMMWWRECRCVICSSSAASASSWLVFGGRAFCAAGLVADQAGKYQRHRLLVYFGKDFAPRNATPRSATAQELQRNKSYNVEQALISVGSGGLTGKGWRQGTQNSPWVICRAAVAHNDFIFSVIAEEKGFMGSVTVLTLYTVILFTGIRIAGQARDRLGKLLAVGVVTMFFSHVFINIGMNIRLMPVTGIPLPLLSYGGSSVLCSLIAIGILQNVYIYRRSY